MTTAAADSQPETQGNNGTKAKARAAEIGIGGMNISGG
jgi:hypothetical protein